MKSDGSKLLEALFDFSASGGGRVSHNPPRATVRSTADYLAFAQGRGIDLQSYDQKAWDAVAEAMGLSDEQRFDFLEEVAGWL